MSVDPPLYNRKKELAELERAWRSGKPELLIAAGRRRAGKSYLLARYLSSRPGLYYQATKATGREQLRSLSEVVAQRFPGTDLQYSGGFSDWESFFRFIVAQAGGKPFGLVLDEVSYLLETVRGFGTLLQKTWDHDFHGTKIKLILSGSYVSAMRRLTAADQPLFGRKTGSLAFAPFSYQDAGAFVPGYAPAERLVAYAMFGGLPGQLALIDAERTIAENVSAHMLNPSGRLADEAEHLFDAFLRDAGVQYSIVRAIASGDQKWNKIRSRIGKDSASLSRPLQWLQDMEVVERVMPVTETPPGNPKKVVYRLTDPYLAFWHRFVASVRATGAADLLEPDDLWRRIVAPRLGEYMGAIFESVCRVFVGRSRHPRLPFQPERVGEWWSDDTREQIDVVALGPDGQVLLGECKWGKITHQDIEALERRQSVLLRELKAARHVHIAAFAGQPVTDAKLRGRIAAGDVLHFSLDDLF